MSSLTTVIKLSLYEVRVRIRSQRMVILGPLLILFIPGSVWGFADPNTTLPGQIAVDGAPTVMFLSSLFVLLSATLGVVLVGFDAISRPRMTGELAIDLAQPIDRRDLAMAHLFGVWGTVAIPVATLQLLSLGLIYRQMDIVPDPLDSGIWIMSTALLLFWYASLQLTASSMAQDLGSSVTFGVATWLFFTLLWLLVTVVIATLLGVDATDTSNLEFIRFQEHADLFSPNGVYQLILQSRLPEVARPTVHPVHLILSTIGWTLLPTGFYLQRFRKLKP